MAVDVSFSYMKSRLIASSALGAWIVPRFGWQAMYFIGGMPLILFFVLRRLVPESPRWLGERERMADADAAVHRFERAARGPVPPVVNSAEFDAMANRHPKRRMADLFGAGVSGAHAGRGDAVDHLRLHPVRSVDVVADDLSRDLSRAAATRAESGGGGFGARRAGVVDLRIAGRQGGTQADHLRVVRVIDTAGSLELVRVYRSGAYDAPRGAQHLG